jgi:hypothetical protein
MIGVCCPHLMSNNIRPSRRFFEECFLARILTSSLHIVLINWLALDAGISQKEYGVLYASA